ncbi:cell division protein SepF [Huintestinicola sp.]|uniref:cell division protein SepF n=1 Tax=Huintestinicola sp. TaxID=2981661 RepID=UPI003D7EBA8B
MGLFDNIKSVLGFDTDPDGYDDGEGGYEDFSQNAPAPQNEGYNIPRNQGMPSPDNNRVNIQVTAQLQVILVKPEKFSDTKEIANHLNNKKTVVLNLEATTPDVTRRIIDFLGGVAYANGGSIKPVANNTFIITPYNVGFQGDELSAELESNGVLL